MNGLVEIPWSFLGEFGAVGIVIAFIWAILTGRLVPARVVEEVRRDRDQWRDTALMREQSLEAALEGVQEVNHAARTTLDLVTELREVTGLDDEVR